MAAFIGSGTTLQIGADTTGLTAPASDTFSSVVQVKSFSGPNIEKPLVEVTNLASTAKEFIGGLSDTGNLEITVQFQDGDTAGQDALRGDAQTSGNVRNFKVTFPDTGATVLDFKGEVVSWSVGSVEAESAVEVTITVKLSGAVTFT